MTCEAKAKSGPKYAARVLEKIDNGKGCWNSTVVGVFDGEIKLGEYTRNYPGFATSTFYPFEQDGKWYAIYSRDYTATQVMSLPDCQDLGGEEPHAHGFCPMEYLVPEMCWRKTNPSDPKPYNPRHDTDRWVVKRPIEKGGVRYLWPGDEGGRDDLAGQFKDECERFDSLRKEWDGRNPFTQEFARWGLIGGCLWGDDSSLKVQFLDLSRVAEGVVTRDDRFGYLELGGRVGLADGVRVEEGEFDTDQVVIQFAVPKSFGIDGEECD